MSVKSKVFVLYTGGTIGMAPEDPNNPASPLKPKPLDELLKYAPSLQKASGIELGFQAFDEPLDSSNVGPTHWVQMAQAIEEAYDNFDGFVILHGTDTMAYTASALAFMFENLGKPVVVTGSQLPISAIRTDATMNLVNAVTIAAYSASNLPRIPEVVVVFADKILRGCRTRKFSISSWAAFDSPNYPHLGSIGEHIRIRTDLLRKMPTPDEQFQVNKDLFRDVLDFALFPGITAQQLRKMFAAAAKPGSQGAVILRTFGAGNAPDYPEFLATIQESVRKNLTVVNITQCFEGSVEMGLYGASNGLLERGVISGLDMTPEAALTKVMWTLGNRLGEQVTNQMQVNQRGEQTENLFDLRFGQCGNANKATDLFREYRTPDRRFDRERLNRAVVRLSGLGFVDVEIDQPVHLRVFMNFANAESSTSSDHPRCVAEFAFTWKGKTVNLVQEIERSQAKTAIGADDILLSVVADPGLEFYFDGLYLALFAGA